MSRGTGDPRRLKPTLVLLEDRTNPAALLDPFTAGMPEWAAGLCGSDRAEAATERTLEADLTGDGVAETVTVTLEDGSPRVVVVDGATTGDATGGTDAATALADFVLDGTDGRRLHVDLKDVTGDGVADLRVGRTVLDGASLGQGQQVELTGAPLGRPPERFGPPRHGRPHGPAPEPLTADEVAAVTTAVVGSYTGSGDGVLSTLSETGAAPSADATTATVALDITTVEPVIPVGDDGTTPLRVFDISGTVTVTLGDSSDPLTLPFTGTLALTGDAADASGRVRISADRGEGGVTTATGFTLAGTLSGDTLSVDWMVVSDHSDPPGGYVFLAPGARDGDPIELTRV